MNAVRVIFVCGLGGAGKTTYAQKLLAQTPGAVLVSHDWYLRDSSSERHKKLDDAMASGDEVRIDNDCNPRNWYEWKSFLRDLETLKQTGKVSVRAAWNQKTGEKNLELNLVLDKKDPVIICDGIYLLHDEVAKLADEIILLKASLDESRRRAEARDSHLQDSAHRARKRAWATKYDIPYFERFAKNATKVVVNDAYLA